MMKKRCGHLRAAAAASCLGPVLAMSVNAAPLFKAEYIPAYVPSALLNDGRVVERAEMSNDTTRCSPGVPPISCVRQSTRFLGLGAVPPLAPVVVPFDFTARAIRVNSAGATVSWPIDFDATDSRAWAGITSDPTLYLSVGLPTGNVSAFAAPDAILPGASAESPYQWSTLSNGGHLVGTLVSSAAPARLAVWSGRGAPVLTSMPADLPYLRVEDADASGRVAVTLSSFVGGEEHSRAAVVNGGNVKLLPLPWLSSWRRSEAVATNDRGEVVGNLIKEGGSSAALWTSGFVFNLGTLPGFKHSLAMGLTSTGAVLACAYNDSTSGGRIVPVGDTRMFIWRNGVRTPWETAVQDVSEGGAMPSSCTVYIDDYLEGPDALANQRGQLLLRSGTQAYRRLTPLK